MAHVNRFYDIPMSKSMRGLCKVEDYEFLGKSENKTPTSGSEKKEENIRRDERNRRRMEREAKEEERLRLIEEERKEKEEQWRSHVAELSSSQEKTQQRLDRIRKFREFQRKVLLDEAEITEGKSGQDPVD